jgi:hypothetical protein
MQILQKHIHIYKYYNGYLVAIIAGCIARHVASKFEDIISLFYLQFQQADEQEMEERHYQLVHIELS